MKFTLEIEMGNDAMQNGEDVAVELVQASMKLTYGYMEGTIRDRNGNTVGRWSFEEETAPAPDPVLGTCPHGINLDTSFCAQGCRV